MWNYISYLKEIIIWSLPFYALHIYLEKIYHISLGQLFFWWTKNFSNTESSTAIIVSFILIFLLFSLPFTSLINSFYLTLFGEKQTLIYLGNPSANTSMYYKKTDSSKTPFQGYNIDKKYSFSFNELNKPKYFIKDPGTENVVGQKNKRLHATAIISTFFFMIFLLLPALGVIHALAYPMYIDINGTSSYLGGDTMKAFELILLNFKITKGLSVLILFGGLFLGMYFGGKMPNDKNTLAVTPIPSSIKQGNNITAMPIEVNIHYETRRNSDDTTSTYDSGFRHAIFRFDKGFDPSVYLTFYFDSTANPKPEEKINSNIDNKVMMNLVINEDLGIRLEYNLDLE